MRNKKESAALERTAPSEELGSTTDEETLDSLLSDGKRFPEHRKFSSGHVETRRLRLRQAGFSGNLTNMQIAMGAIGDPRATRRANDAGIFVPDDEILAFELIDAAKSTTEEATAYLRDLEWIEFGAHRVERPFANLLDVRCFVDFRIDRTRSRGGRYSQKRRTEQSCELFDLELDRGRRGPAISIAFARHYRETKTSNIVIEYSRISTDPEIGEFVVVERTDNMRVVTLHEVAHAAQDSREEFSDAPHGLFWQAIYRLLRRRFGLVEPHRKRPIVSNCEHCGCPFAPKRKDAKYCAPRCRTAARRTRLKENASQIGEPGGGERGGC